MTIVCVYCILEYLIAISLCALLMIMCVKDLTNWSAMFNI